MTVRIAVAGAGLIGRRHIEEIDASASAELAAVVDPERLGDQVDRELLQQPGVDVVHTEQPGHVEHRALRVPLRAVPIGVGAPSGEVLDLADRHAVLGRDRHHRGVVQAGVAVVLRAQPDPGEPGSGGRPDPLGEGHRGPERVRADDQRRGAHSWAHAPHSGRPEHRRSGTSGERDPMGCTLPAERDLFGASGRPGWRIGGEGVLPVRTKFSGDLAVNVAQETSRVIHTPESDEHGHSNAGGDTKSGSGAGNDSQAGGRDAGTGSERKPEDGYTDSVHPIRRIQSSVVRYSSAGSIIWISSIQFFLVQVVVASAWKLPYSWRLNAISDLGATGCGQFDDRFVCSPLHGLMNTSLILLGLSMAIGSALMYAEFRNSRVGFGLMALAGIGVILVGLFPEDTIYWAHVTGQDLAFVIGNIALIVFGFTLHLQRWFRWYSVSSGAVALVALYLFLSHNRLFLGLGGMERVVAYPLIVWLIVAGMYMLRTQLVAKRVDTSDS